MAIGSYKKEEEVVKVPFNYRVNIVFQAGTPEGSEKVVEIALPTRFSFSKTSYFPQKFVVSSVAFYPQNGIGLNLLVAPAEDVDVEGAQPLLDYNVTSTITITSVEYSGIEGKKLFCYAKATTNITVSLQVTLDIKGYIECL